MSGKVLGIQSDDFKTFVAYAGTATITTEHSTGVTDQTTYDGTTYSFADAPYTDTLWVLTEPEQGGPGAPYMPTLNAVDTTGGGAVDLEIVAGGVIDQIYSAAALSVQRQLGTAQLVLRFVDATGTPAAGRVVTTAASSTIVYSDQGGVERQRQRHRRRGPGADPEHGAGQRAGEHRQHAGLQRSRPGRHGHARDLPRALSDSRFAVPRRTGIPNDSCTRPASRCRPGRPECPHSLRIAGPARYPAHRRPVARSRDRDRFVRIAARFAARDTTFLVHRADRRARGRARNVGNAAAAAIAIRGSAPDRQPSPYQPRDGHAPGGGWMQRVGDERRGGDECSPVDRGVPRWTAPGRLW